MLIPPSAMLIIYAIVTEQSVGQMFVAGIISLASPLSIAYGVLILLLSYMRRQSFVGGQDAADVAAEDWAHLTTGGIWSGKIVPVCHSGARRFGRHLRRRGSLRWRQERSSVRWRHW